MALLPWSYRIEDDRPERVAVKFAVVTTRTPFLLERTMLLEGSAPILQLRERVVNEGDEVLEFMWARIIPRSDVRFLDEPCEVVLPRCEVVTLAAGNPDYFTSGRASGQVATRERQAGTAIDLSGMPGPEPKAHDLAFLRGFDEGRYEIRNQRGLSFQMRLPIHIFPYLWYWQVTRGAVGYPWYGTTYNLALEPHSSLFPMLPRALEQGHVLKLGPGQELTAELEAAVLPC